MTKLFFLCSLLGLLATQAHGHGDKHTQQGAAKPAAAATAETAFGRPGLAKSATRTVRVDMSDRMRFSPDVLSVKRGETVRFEVSNSGKLLHEMVIGTEQDLKEHAALMRKFPGMEHDEPYMVHVAAGKKGTLVWQFTKPGSFYYGCLVPGHFEAGMVGRIQVNP